MERQRRKTDDCLAATIVDNGQVQVSVHDQQITKSVRIVRHLFGRTDLGQEVADQLLLALEFEQRATVKLMRECKIADGNRHGDNHETDRGADGGQAGRQRNLVSNQPQWMQMRPLPGLRVEHIADAAHGVNQLCLKGFVNLDAKTSDRDFDDVGIRVKINVPHE